MTDWGLGAIIFSTLILLLSRWSNRLYTHLPIPSLQISRSWLPDLTIIIPARNEEANLHQILPSLQGLRYPGQCEWIVVDDGSSDATAAVAKKLHSKILTITGPPKGWLGKPYACHQGAAAARGEWLLFTDADTIHSEDGPARAVQYALDNDLEAASFFLQQDFQSWIDRSALMVAFSGLFLGLGREPTGLNGQYILIRRSTYEITGGFSAVRGEPLEDLAFGRFLGAAGLRVSLGRGESLARVAMYSDFSHLWRGLLRLGGGSLRWIGPRSVLMIGLTTFAWFIPAVSLVALFLGSMHPAEVVMVWVLVWVGFLPWARRFGGILTSTLAPFGALIVQMAGTTGLLLGITGRGVVWKGRQVRRR